MKILSHIFKNILLPLFLLAIFLGLGNGIQKYLLSFIPGAIIGMLLLFLALQLTIIPYSLMKNFAARLTKHISLFLIPVSVSILTLYPLIKEYFLELSLLLSLSLILVLVTTGFIAERIQNSSGLEDHKDD